VLAITMPLSRKTLPDLENSAMASCAAAIARRSERE
jgi:hypothetical protein